MASSFNFGATDEKVEGKCHSANIENASFLQFDGKTDMKATVENIVFRDVPSSLIGSQMDSPFARPMLARGYTPCTQTVYRSAVFRSVSLGTGPQREMLAGFDGGAEELYMKKSATVGSIPTLRGEPPQPPGGYLEKATTFFTTVGPQKAMQHFVEILKDLQIDYTMRPDKFKLKCETYPRGVRLPFNVRMFSQGQRYAVELQKRAGDTVCFSKIYNDFVAKCAARGLCKASTASKWPPSGFNVVKFSIFDSDELDVSMNPLMKMADSEFVDTKSVAVAALSDLTSDKAVVDWIASKMESYAELFVKLIRCKTEDVHRAAISCVANMSLNEDVCGAFKKTDCTLNLVKMLSSENAQVVRESTRALKNLGTCLGKGCFRAAGFGQSDLHNLLSSNDSRVRDHAASLKRILC